MTITLKEWLKLRRQVLERDQYTCQCCYRTETPFDIHHIIPRRKNGLDSINNLITLCEPCHELLELKRLGPKHDYSGIINVRAARSDKDYVPLIISIPRSIVETTKIKKDDKLHMYTDGDRIYLDKIKEPEL